VPLASTRSNSKQKERSEVRYEEVKKVFVKVLECLCHFKCGGVVSLLISFKVLVIFKSIIRFITSDVLLLTRTQSGSSLSKTPFSRSK